MLTLLADPDNQVSESDETNNTVTLTAIGPNLVLDDTRITYPTSTTARIALAVANTGYAPAAATEVEMWQQPVTSTNILSHTSDLRLKVPAVEGQDRVVVTATWQIGELSAGTYPLWVRVDANETLRETSEQDNLTFADSLEIAPDLALVLGSIQQVNARTLELTVRNEGNRPVANWTTSVLSGGEIDTALAALERNISATTLEPGDSLVLTVPFETPLPDSYRVWLDPDNEIAELAEWNNTLTHNEPEEEEDVVDDDEVWRLYLPLIQY
jgi:subtilase family serine protease